MKVNLEKEVFSLIKQIPKGMVTTYKEIAIALGDEIASRAVGQILSKNKELEKIPCYKVIHNDGRVGGYVLGKDEKIKRLESEGIEIKNNRVQNFENLVFRNFVTNFPLKKLKDEQNKMSKKIIIKDTFNEIDWVAGVDVSYKDDKAKAGLVIMDMDFNVIKEKTILSKPTFPYIPTYLSYREIPIYSKLIHGENFDILFVDGNGILHPRKMGIATQLGILLDKPTIGIAKSLLLGELKNNKIFIDGELRGVKVGKVFVSPGHKISFKSAITLTKRFMKGKLPEPLRLAHQLSRC